MFEKMFRPVNLLERGLDASALRQQTIAQNMANADTPGYKSKNVNFEDAFRSALKDNSGFQAKTTRDRHIKFGAANDPLDVYPEVVTNANYTMRMDENNVDPDQEMVALAKNTLQYDLLITKMNGELARLRMAIREGQ